MNDKIYFAEELCDSILLSKDMARHDLGVSFDESGEHEAVFRFFDGYAVESDEDGNVLLEDNPIVLYYPTLDEVRGSRSLQSHIRDYTMRDDINQYDVALKFGVPSRYRTLKDETDIRDLLMPYQTGSGVMVFLQYPVLFNDELKSSIVGVWVDRRDPSKDCVVHDRGVHWDRSEPYNRLTRSFYEFVSPEVRSRIFSQLAQMRNSSDIYAVSYGSDSANVVTVPGKTDIFQDATSREHHVTASKSVVKDGKPAFEYSFKDFNTALHFAAEVMSERLNYGRVIEIEDMPNCRVTVPTENGKLVDLAKFHHGYPDLDRDVPMYFQPLLLCTFDRKSDAEAFSKSVRDLNCLSVGYLRDRIKDGRARSMTEEQRVHVDAYLTRYGGDDTEGRKSAAARLWTEVILSDDIKRLPASWRDDALHELTDLVGGKVREDRFVGLSR